MTPFLFWIIIVGTTVAQKNNSSTIPVKFSEFQTNPVNKNNITTTGASITRSLLVTDVFRPVSWPVMETNFTYFSQNKTLLISWRKKEEYHKNIIYYFIKIINVTTNQCIHAAYYNASQYDNHSLQVANISQQSDKCSISDLSNNKTDLIIGRIKQFSALIKIKSNEIKLVNETQAKTAETDLLMINVTISTKVPKPGPPSDVFTKKKDPYSLKVSWITSNESNDQGPAKGYIITNINSSDARNFSENWTEFKNLTACSKYCFKIMAFNDAGNSSSLQKCFKTQPSNLSEVTLSSIASEYRNSRNISWQYQEPGNCPIEYQLQYRIKDSNWTHVNISQKTFYEIRNLELNVIFEIRVKAFRNFDPEYRGKKEVFSKMIPFYTGEEKIRIGNNSLNTSVTWSTRELVISWTIPKEVINAILGYSLRISDRSRKCLTSVAYQPESPAIKKRVSESLSKNISFFLEHCPKKSQSSFRNETKFASKLDLPKKGNIFFLEIFAVNALGLHNITNITGIKLVLKKPGIPQSINVKQGYMYNLKVSWAASIENNEQGPPEGYRITNVNSSDVRPVKESHYEFINLKPCSNYCFTVEAFNDAGNSSPSSLNCFQTKAPNLSSVNLSSIASGYRNTRNITWQYQGSDHCPIEYHLQYETKFSKRKQSINRYKQTFYEVTNLTLNEIFQVYVKAVRDSDNKDREKKGVSSEIVEFYTGEENISIRNLTYSINWKDKNLSISWNLDERYENAIYFYILKVFENSRKNCLGGFIFECSTCASVGKQNLESILNNQSFENKNCKFVPLTPFSGKDNKFQAVMNLNIQTDVLLLEVDGINLQGMQRITNQNIEIEPSKPLSPESIYKRNHGLNFLYLVWNVSERTDSHSPAKWYKITNTNSSDVRRVNETYSEFTNLRPCSRYCFTIEAHNYAGSSSISSLKCFKTKAPDLSAVTLSSIASEYRDSRNITWQYLGSENCPIEYQLQFRIKGSDWRQSINTSQKTFYEIKNLELNEIFEIRVKASRDFDPEYLDKKEGFSTVVEFYTGEKIPIIMNFTESYDVYKGQFHFSWAVNTSRNQIIFAYLILVKNLNNSCLLKFEMPCTGCSRFEREKQLYKKKKLGLYEESKCKNKSHVPTTFQNLSNFKQILPVEMPTGNYSVHFYAYNLFGFHKLDYRENAVYEAENYILRTIVGGFIVLIIMFLVFIVAYAVWKKGRTSPLKKAEKRSQSPHESRQNIENIEKDEEFGDCESLEQFLAKINDYNIGVKDFSSYFETVTENNFSELNDQYKGIGTLSVKLEKQLKLTTNVGKLLHNITKNRFINILPFDRNRVILQDKSPRQNYVNANFIPFSDTNDKVEYIASQGPIETTISDFITMIWEQNINCIVMLTRPYEDNKFKCLQYWPDDLGTVSYFGSNEEFHMIKLIEKVEDSHYERKLVLKNTITKEERFIYQLHMHTWLDFLAPDVNHFNSVIQRFQEMTETFVSTPFLIHCSAGVGRTGTFICLNKIVGQLNKGIDHIDVFKTVLELRASRMSMVQRKAQYIFIHEFLNYYIQNELRNENSRSSFHETLVV